MLSYLRYKRQMWNWWWSIPTWHEWRYKRNVSMDTWRILNERWWSSKPQPPVGKEHWDRYRKAPPKEVMQILIKGDN